LFDGYFGAGYAAIGYRGTFGSGPLLSLGAAAAYSSGKVALGPALDISILPNIKGVRGPISGIEGAGVASVSIMAIFRSQESGVELATTLGLTGGVFSGYSNAVYIIGGSPKVTSYELPIGPRASVRLGYVWKDGVGLALSSSASIFGADGEAIIPITFLGNATWSTW
jgi:hypothetical protein